MHMNVYKMKGQACGGPLKTEVKELKGDLRPAPPYPSRVKTVDKGTQVTPEREAVRAHMFSVVGLKHNICVERFFLKVILILLLFKQVTVKEKGSKSEDEPPPMWFRSYMEKVKYDLRCVQHCYVPFLNVFLFFIV